MKVTLWPGCWSFPPLITLVSTQQGFPVPWFLAFIHVTGPCLLSLIWWSFPRQFLTQFANEILRLGSPDEYLPYFSSVFFPWSTGVHSKARLLLLPLLSSIWRFEKPPIFPSLPSPLPLLSPGYSQPQFMEVQDAAIHPGQLLRVRKERKVKKSYIGETATFTTKICAVSFTVRMIK